MHSEHSDHQRPALRQITQILGYHQPTDASSPACARDRRYQLGGTHRKTHRLDALGIMDRAQRHSLAWGEWEKRAACCELCRRTFVIIDNAITSCQRGDCLPRAGALRGLPRPEVPPLLRGRCMDCGRELAPSSQVGHPATWRCPSCTP